MTLNELRDATHNNSLAHGFWGEVDVFESIPEKLCLIHSEVSEALEDHRDGAYKTVLLKDGKPVGFSSELADILIRVFDLAGALDIDLDHEVDIKMAYNKLRPYKHGKRC